MQWRWRLFYRFCCSFSKEVWNLLYLFDVSLRVCLFHLFDVLRLRSFHFSIMFCKQIYGLSEGSHSYKWHRLKVVLRLNSGIWTYTYMSRSCDDSPESSGLQTFVERENGDGFTPAELYLALVSSLDRLDWHWTETFKTTLFSSCCG